MNLIYKIHRWVELHTGSLSSVFEVVPFVLLTTLLYCCIRRLILKHRFGNQLKAVCSMCVLNEIVRVLLVCEISAIVSMTLSPNNFWKYFWSWLGGKPWEFHMYGFGHIGPFPITVLCLLGEYSWRDFLIFFPEMAMNVIFFIPLGFSLPFVLKKSQMKRIVIFGLLISLFVEVVQPFIGRDGTISDVICNTLGAALGYLLYLLMKKLFPNFTEKGRLSANDVWAQMHS